MHLYYFSSFHHYILFLPFFFFFFPRRHLQPSPYTYSHFNEHPQLSPTALNFLLRLFLRPSLRFSPSISSLLGVYSVRYAGHTLLPVLFLSHPSPTLLLLNTSLHSCLPPLQSNLFQRSPHPYSNFSLFHLYTSSHSSNGCYSFPPTYLFQLPTLSPHAQSVFFLGHLFPLSLLSVTPTSTFYLHFFFSLKPSLRVFPLYFSTSVFSPVSPCLLFLPVYLFTL